MSIAHYSEYVVSPNEDVTSRSYLTLECKRCHVVAAGDGFDTLLYDFAAWADKHEAECRARMQRATWGETE